MKRLFAVRALLFIALFSCKSTSKDPNDAELFSSVRDLVIPDSEIEGIPFNFCPEKRSFSLNNALWMTYFASNQYTHFKELAPALERLGFGAKGEGMGFKRAWYLLRLKRIEESKVDKDDTWKNETERLARLASVTREFEETFRETYTPDGVRAADFERKIVSAAGADAKISFFSGTILNKKGILQTTSSQAFYAEHQKLDLSVLVFRGTETDAYRDIFSDLGLLTQPFDGLGNSHSGFTNALKEIEGPIIENLKRRSEKKPINLWVGGHSLGASLATLFTARILALHERGELKSVRLVGLYNIGSPRVGDLSFAKKFDELAMKEQANVVRIRNYKDLVTGVPFGRNLDPGYWHVGALAYFDHSGTLYWGDGWEAVDGKSDINASTPTSGANHESQQYWKWIKAAYQKAGQSPQTDCMVRAGDRPLLPYQEYNPKRTETPSTL